MVRAVFSSDAAAAAATATHRDRYVDLLRAVAILLVVVGHWLAVNLTVHDGRVSGANAGADVLQLLPWARPLTWLFQVMPIFFLVGGYANTASWSSHQRRGGDATTWVRSRMFRLLRPTAIFVFTLAATKALGWVLKFDPDIVGGAVWVAAIALWFVVVYLAVVALAPALITWQRRWGHVTIIALLVAGVGVIDLSRLVFAVPIVASLSYLLGWLAVHQLGVAWRDGVLTRNPRTAWLLAGGGLLSLLVLTGPGPYAVSMFGAVGTGLQNIAPPTLALLALATSQTGLILLLHDPVERWLIQPRRWTAVVAVNAVVFTIYLWHMVAVVIVALALVLTGALPQYPIGSVAWLLLRLPWLLALTVVLIALVRTFSRWERPRLYGAQAGQLRASPQTTARLATGVLSCLAALSALVNTRFAGIAPTAVPIVELTAFTIGLLLVGLPVPNIKRQDRLCGDSGPA